MRTITTGSLLCIFLVFFSLLSTQPAFAHGSEPRLEINLERINPGGVLDVRGVEFDYEQSVTLYLERTGIVVELGNVMTDVDGVFLHIVALPADLPQGVYNVRALAGHHDVLSPALTVQGSPILEEGGGQGERDEDDGLLVPMPTYAPGVSSTPLPQKITTETPEAKPGTIRLLYLILFGLSLLGLVGLRTLMKR